MARWDSFTIGENQVLNQLANSADLAINNVNFGLDVIKQAAEVAKVFLGGAVAPHLVLLLKALEELEVILNDYKQLGWHMLIIDPSDPNYGASFRSANLQFGFEILRDESGLPIFNDSVVANPNSFFDGQRSVVNIEYRKSLDLNDLSVLYKDRMGRFKTDAKFTPPIPKTSTTKIVQGGYNPSTWNGTRKSKSLIPLLPATETIQLMVDAFNDEGDIPKYEIGNKTKNWADKGGPYTRTGATFQGVVKDSLTGEYIQNYDPWALYNQPLYYLPLENSDGTVLTLEEREPITTLLKFGKPNAEGSEYGSNISALALIIATVDPEDFLNAVKALVPFFTGGKLGVILDKIVKAYEELLTPKTIKMTVETNTKYGAFSVNDIIKGDKSGTVGRIDKITKTEPSVRTKTDYVAIQNDFGEVVDIQKIETNTNVEGLWQNQYVEYTPLDVTSVRFLPSELIFQAEAVNTVDFLGTPDIEYVVKGEKDKGSVQAKTEATLSSIPLPKYGISRGVDAIAPESVLPDFEGFSVSQIPGWTDFIDTLIEFVNGLKGIVEDSLAFIQALIDAIDDLIEFFQELAAAIIKFLELFKISLPASGIYALPITTNQGVSAVQSALQSSDNAPSSDLKYSAGILFVGSAVGGNDPLVFFGELLGLSFQSVE